MISIGFPERRLWGNTSFTWDPVKETLTGTCIPFGEENAHGTVYAHGAFGPEQRFSKYPLPLTLEEELVGTVNTVIVREEGVYFIAKLENTFSRYRQVKDAMAANYRHVDPLVAPLKKRREGKRTIIEQGVLLAIDITRQPVFVEGLPREQYGKQEEDIATLLSKALTEH